MPCRRSFCSEHVFQIGARKPQRTSIKLATTASTTDRSANRCRKATDGMVSDTPEGGCQPISDHSSLHALETLRFGCVFVCKLPIDRRGPITEGIDVLPAQRSGQPFLAAGPADGFACAEIDDMRAATEGIEARSGAGEGILCRDQDYAAWPSSRREASTWHTARPAKDY